MTKMAETWQDGKGAVIGDRPIAVYAERRIVLHVGRVQLILTENEAKYIANEIKREVRDS